MTELDRIRDMVEVATTEAQLDIARAKLTAYQLKQQKSPKLQEAKDKLLSEIDLVEDIYEKQKKQPQTIETTTRGVYDEATLGESAKKK